MGMMGLLFYHFCWNIIDNDVCKAVREPFLYNWILIGINFIVVSFISKFNGAIILDLLFSEF